MELPIEVKLKRPINRGDETIDVLFFDEPDIGSQIDYADLEAELSDPPTQKDAARVNIFWLARLSGQPEEVIRKIKETDIPAVNKVADIIMGVDASNAGGTSAGNETPAE